MILSVKVPEVLVHGNLKSKWNAAWNKVEFELKRQDFQIIQVQNTAVPGFFYANILGANVLPVLMPPGDYGTTQYWYINSGPYNGIYEVYSSTNVSPTQDVVTFKGDFLGNSFGGFLNVSRKNYHIETFVYQVFGTQEILINPPILSSSGPEGKILIDVKKWLQGKLKLTKHHAQLPGSQYSFISLKDSDLGFLFRVECWERYEGYDAPAPIFIADKDYLWGVINAAQQPGNLHGENMGEYVPFTAADGAANSIPESKKMKFLSGFKVPTYFVGYPFDIAWLYAETLEGRQLSRAENVGGVTLTAIPTTQKNGVNRMILAGGYASTVKQIEVWIDDSGTVDDFERYVELDYMDEDYVDPL